jgi:hypothetical protein
MKGGSGTTFVSSYAKITNDMLPENPDKMVTIRAAPVISILFCFVAWNIKG